MIVDKIKNLKSYERKINGLDNVLFFLNSNDLKTLPCGKYEIEGDNVYLSLQEYETKPETTILPELHRKYIDIQMVIEGKEKIGYTDISKTLPNIPYDEDKDIEFVSGDVEFFEADEGNFLIFFPNDAHKPSISTDKPAKVKKAVFKIKT